MTRRFRAAVEGGPTLLLVPCVPNFATCVRARVPEGDVVRCAGVLRVGAFERRDLCRVAAEASADQDASASMDLLSLNVTGKKSCGKAMMVAS